METTVVGMDAILAAVDTVTSVVGSVFTVMTGNALITFFLAISVIGAGVGLFHRLKRG